MVGAHDAAGRSGVPSHARSYVRARGPRPAEVGFTIVELLVVLIIVSILMAIALPQLNKARTRSSGPAISLSSGAIWRGVMSYRLENQGVLPATTKLANKGATFVNPGGGPYVKHWPSDATNAASLVVAASTATTPPATVSATRTGTVLYATLPVGSPNPVQGWLAGYEPTGKLVYRRIISTNGAAPGPIG
jgi:prepilin-type N-terminal cleavage/methylation domain-containing protein